MDLLSTKRKLLPLSGYLDMGGGSGSSTSGGTSVQELPEWARGYAKDTLSKAAALTDINQNPYQTYGQNRIAGFSPMQETAMQNAANIQTGPEAFQKGVTGYMNPYIEQALKPQIAEANRGYDVSAQKQQGQATQAGAFGGGRDAVMRAENERNRNMGIQNIVGQGYNTAFNNAQNQYNTGFNQNIMANQLQSQYGTMQQNQAQKGLDTAYQDFLNQQNYPYKQLGFMSDLVRGMPLGQQTTQQMYQPAPNLAQNIGAVGLGAYGMSKFMADGGVTEGGITEGYKLGGSIPGGSVMSRENVDEIVHNSIPHDADLHKAMQAAHARGDQDELEAIQNELGFRASMRRGIAGGVTDQMADRMAGGGIIAFAGNEQNNDPVGGQMVVSEGDRDLYRRAGKEGFGVFDELGAFKGYTPMTKEERAAQTKKSFGEFQQFAGEDPYASMADKLAKMDADRLVNLEKEKGAAAFEAIPAILQGRGIRGIGAGVGKLGSGLAAAAKADAAEKRALAQQDFLVKDAQRKERMGLTRDAMAETDKIEASGVAAAKARKDALVAKGNLAANLAKAYRPVGTGAGSAGKNPKLAEQLAAAEIAHEKNPTEETLKTVTGLRRAMAQSKTTDVGATKADLTREGRVSNENAKVQAAMKSFKYDPAYMEAKQAGQDEADRVWNEELARQRQFFGTTSPVVVNRNSGNNTPPPPPGFVVPSR